MKRLIETLTGGYGPSARVVDGSLILSLPNATTPVVWRLELESVKSAALEVTETTDGLYMLSLKNGSKAAQDIAPFEKRAQAVHALMAASHALEQAQGQMRNRTADGAAVVMTAAVRPRRRVMRWVGIILLLLAALIAFSLMTAQNPRHVSMSAKTQQTPQQMMTQPQNDVGVPVDGNSFLQNR